MTTDSSVFLKHILESIELVEKETATISEEEFRQNVPVQDAVIRRLEIIGEAIRHLSEDIKSKNPDVPWQDIVDTRNKLIHDYFGVDLGLVWKMIKKDVPPLKNRVTEILEMI